MDLKDSVMTNISTFYLVVGVFLGIVISMKCAKAYRNTNDFKKSLRLSMMLSGIIFVLLLLKLPLFVCVMLWLCTQILTALYSNYYFYQ